MADYGPTLEVVDFLEDVDGEPEEEENEEEPWGRLFPVRKGVSSLGKSESRLVRTRAK